ncbi:2-succinyl-6-hydroxy-2,4-cyclohexadiene-1-carboxylate synthase [Virgibacillus xinjiangensis]|uniref:Putative 2-succinyl-6-hydroxy-2,4-cyclohexadiene-1-carboxylate synthase n=1 Tax=Virgibacillus xinjiangensis TaxID=393090 RepID=A0ABV7CYE9_9BACI
MYFTIDDASYWYEVHGEGVPLVMLHGFTGSSQTWSEFICHHSEGVQVIVVDLPGHGSTTISSIRTMEDCCRDLRALFLSMGLDQFHLAGYSMGGRTALSFAMLYPELLKSLILESASPGLEGQMREDRREMDAKLARRIERGGLSAFVDFWEQLPLFESQKQLPSHVRAAVREERMSQTEEGLAQSLRGMGTGRQPSWWHMLCGLSLPVLLLAGEQDEKFVKINQEMAEKLPLHTLKIVAGAGHAIHVEKPGKFGKLVSGFIKNYSSSLSLHKD